MSAEFTIHIAPVKNEQQELREILSREDVACLAETVVVEWPDQKVTVVFVAPKNPIILHDSSHNYTNFSFGRTPEKIARAQQAALTDAQPLTDFASSLSTMVEPAAFDPYLYRLKPAIVELLPTQQGERTLLIVGPNTDFINENTKPNIADELVLNFQNGLPHSPGTLVRNLQMLHTNSFGKPWLSPRVRQPQG